MVGAARSRQAYSLTDITPARTIWVYRNGDPFYTGRKFVINHRYVPNFEAFMIQLNEGVPTPFGVRNIYTPRQGHSVTDLPDFQQGGKYVVAGRERFKKLNYFNIGVKKPYRKKEEVIRPVVHSNIQVPSKWHSIYNKPRNINVFTNGDTLIPPIKILIPKFTLKSWNGVLGLVNEKVFPHSGAVHRLYTLNGHFVHGPDDLEDNQFYVGCGKEKFKHLPYWQHPKVPEYIRRNFSNSLGPPEKPHSKKPLIEPSKKEGSARPPIQPLKGEGEGDRPSVYHAKPEKASREKAPRLLSSDNESSVYKAQQSPKEIEGAQQIQDDKNIQVEVPLDQVDAMFQLRLSKKKTSIQMLGLEKKRFQLRLSKKKTFIQMLGLEKKSLQKRTKEVIMRKKKQKKREKKQLRRKRSVQNPDISEKKGIFKKMFGFFFSKSKKKDSKEGDKIEQHAKKQTKPYSADNEFFDAYDYD